MAGPAPFTHSTFAGLIGVARQDITPPIGIYSRCWGAATHDCADGIHRPFTLTAFTLQTDQDSPPLVLIAADLGWFQGRDTEWFMRGHILEALKLQENRLIYNLSHTHSGPPLADRKDVPGGELIMPYLKQIRESGVRAVQLALQKRQPAVLSWHYGQCGLAQNRDLQDPAKERLITGYNPARGCDQTLLVGRVTNEGGEILATLANYACHPVTLAWQNHLLSPDFVGATREVVEGHTNGAPCIFLQGASGELAPREEYVGDIEIAEANGRQLGYAVLATLEGMLPHRSRLAYGGVVESGAPLGIWNRESETPATRLEALQVDVEFELKEMPPLAQLEKDFKECKERPFAERIRRKIAIRKDMGDGRSIKIPVWIWRVGDALIVGQSNEAYSDFQLAVRKVAAPRATVVMNLVNGAYGYLPPKELYKHDLYQVWQSPFAAGCLERLVDTTSAAVRGLLT